MLSAAFSTSLTGKAAATAGALDEADAASAAESIELSELFPPPQADKNVVVSSRGIIIFFIACFTRSFKGVNGLS